MHRAGHALAPLVAELGLGPGISLHRLRGRWAEIFPGPPGMHSRPQSLTEGRLLIVVDSPAWLQEMRFQSAALLRKLGGYGVSELAFRVGTASRPPKREKKAEPLRPLGPEDRDLIDSTTEPVADPVLREALRRAMAKSLASPHSSR